jgi:hypothetical protein
MLTQLIIKEQGPELLRDPGINPGMIVFISLPPLSFVEFTLPRRAFQQIVSK